MIALIYAGGYAFFAVFAHALMADSAISLLVSDDGQGMTLTAQREGVGLAGLREWAREIGLL